METGPEQRRQGTVDPGLYTRVFFLLERGERQQAVEVACTELGCDASEGEAFADRVWASHLDETAAEEENPPVPQQTGLVAGLFLAAVRLFTGG